MTELFIDESGSMTTESHKAFPFFVICIVRVIDKERLKKRFKRFISSNLKELREIDRNNKMFSNNKFHELKGSSLTKETKLKFVDYICRDNLFEVYYIKIDNKKINDKLYNNKVRAFNYIIGLSLLHNIKNNNLPIKDDFHLNIDERNVKTQSINTLEDYLNIKLTMELELIDELKVKYYDSANNHLIQISDFFSNLYYSKLMTKKSYDKLFDNLEKQGYIKDFFNFPMNN